MIADPRCSFGQEILHFDGFNADFALLSIPNRRRRRRMVSSGRLRPSPRASDGWVATNLRLCAKNGNQRQRISRRLSFGTICSSPVGDSPNPKEAAAPPNQKQAANAPVRNRQQTLLRSIQRSFRTFRRSWPSSAGNGSRFCGGASATVSRRQTFTIVATVARTL
jgi:hypothetical protein